MPITWSAALETGHPVIDSQHKEIVSVVEKLLTACKTGQADDKVGATMDYLVSYTKKHLSEEEVLQQKSNFPGYAQHRELHAAFVRDVTELAAELKRTGPTPTLNNKILRNVADWLINHIKQEDSKLAAHIKSTGG